MRYWALAFILVFAAGCSKLTASGDRGREAPVEERGKPVTEQDLNAMPPQARAAAQQSMERGRALSAQYNERYGGKK